jgi:hypothetical protein
MKRVFIALLAIGILAAPPRLRAQSWNDTRADPDEYDDAEDGHPLKLISYILAPVGFALEWGITRPLHNLTTETVLAPVYKGNSADEVFPRQAPPIERIEPLPPPRAAIEPQPASLSNLPPSELYVSPKQSQAGGPASKYNNGQGGSASSPTYQNDTGQPVLH